MNKHSEISNEEIPNLDKMALIAQLQAHQIELEMQNQELRETQQLLEETRDRYADLYDFAPVGYLTVDKAGRIRSINLTGAILLDLERVSVIGKPLKDFFCQKDSQKFFDYLYQTFNTCSNTVNEFEINHSSDCKRHIRLESSVISGHNTCRMVMTDISQLKKSLHRNQELLNENRRLMKNIYQAQEQERCAIARELHDELGQWLTAIYAEAEIISSYADKDSIIIGSCQEIKNCSQRMHELMRGMLHKLRPVLLDTLGLPDALLDLKEQWHKHHTHTTLELTLEGKFENLDEHISITVYRIVQEALNNISSHANATKASIHLRCKPDENNKSSLMLCVEDNGTGYDLTLNPKGFGLLGMRERAIAAGGKLTVCSVPKEGTKICVKLPLKHKKNENDPGHNHLT